MTLTECRILSLEQQHLEAVQRLEESCFAEPWSLDMLKEELRAPAGLALVAEKDGQICAYALLLCVSGQAELLRIATDGACRRQGVGRRLLRACMERLEQRGCRELFVEVRESNAAARALYESEGFEQVGRRPRYYVLPCEDALILRRALNPPPEGR